MCTQMTVLLVPTAHFEGLLQHFYCRSRSKNRVWKRNSVLMAGSTSSSNYALNVNTTSRPITTTLGLLQTNPYTTAVLLCIYIAFFLVGLIGNIVVITVVIRYKTMQTVTNRFIAWLSISDILLCLFAIPFTPTNAILTSWIFGRVMCKLVPSILAVSVFASTFTSVAIAMDRYMIIVHPYIKRMTNRIQAAIMILIWISSIAVSVPIFVYSSQENEPNDANVTSCRENWPEGHAEAVIGYNWSVLTLQLLLPFIVITFCYASVSVKLYRQSEIKMNFQQEARARVEAKRNRRINKMLIAMVVVFLICWLPLHMWQFFVDELPEEHQLAVFLVTHVIAMSSVIYNPFLYGWMNENFRASFRKIIPCLKEQQIFREEETRNTTNTMIGKLDRSQGSSSHELTTMVKTNNNNSVCANGIDEESTKDQTPFIVVDSEEPLLMDRKDRYINQGFK